MVTVKTLTTTCANPVCGNTFTGQQLADNWYALQLPGGRIHACTGSCLHVAVQFGRDTSCGRDDCAATATSGHLYCTTACRDQDQRDTIGLASVWGSSSLNDRLAAIRTRQAMLPAGAY